MTPVLAFGIPAVLLAISIWLIGSEREMRRDIGKSLLTGSIVAFAVFALQLHLDSKRRSQEKLEQFRLSVSFAENLRGLEPEYPLAGMYLSGKTLDNAELQGEDLTGTNLQGASLRGADLEDAELDGANLYGTVLTGASLIDADLTDADLRGTRLALAKLVIPPDPADFLGAQVNARTCWPEDFLANVHLSSELQDALLRRPTKVHGRTLVEAESPRSWGRACVLHDQNIWDDLGLYADGQIVKTVPADELRQTAERLAVTFGRKVTNILARFDGGRPMSEFGAKAPAVQRRICAGSNRVVMQAAAFTPQEFGFLLVSRPGQPPGKTTVIRQPDDHPGRSYAILFQKPLSVGTELDLVVEQPDGKSFVKFVSHRDVRPC